MNNFKPSAFCIAVLLLPVTLASSAPAVSGSPSDLSSVQALVDKVAHALNAKDLKAFGSSFAEDGEFMNPVGMSAKGRTAIEEFHAPMFAERREPNKPSFTHARFTVLDKSIRFLRPDVAAVNIKWEQTGAIAPDGSPWGTRRGILSWVVTRNNGVWLIAVWHNLELPKDQ